jgi:hypothetical protein
LPKAEMHVVPARGTDIVLDAVKTPLVHSVAKNERNTIRNLSGHAGNYRTALSRFKVVPALYRGHPLGTLAV